MLCNSKLVWNFEQGLTLVLNFKLEKTIINHLLIQFQVLKMGLKPILDFSGPDSGPDFCVVWNVLYNHIQPIFPVPVPIPE